MQNDDVEKLRRVIPLWRATRAWAEELLCAAFRLSRAQDVLNREHRGKHRIPGTNWFCRTHGLGVDIDRGIACGGIDFDFNQACPDAWRLRLFVEKQVNAGELTLDYAELADDEERFKRAAEVLLASDKAAFVRAT
jgi:hypothetical protein